MFDKLKKLGRRGKAILMAACVACTCAVTSVAAFAEEVTESTDVATSVGIGDVISSAGSTMQDQFVVAIQSFIPVVIGIMISSLGLYAIWALFKLVKKAFNSATG